MVFTAADVERAWEEGHQEGYTLGHGEGLTTGQRRGFAQGAEAKAGRTLWIAVDTRWRDLRARDVIAGADDELYTVARSGWRPVPGQPGQRGSWGLTLTSGGQSSTHEGDPDDMAPVLVRVDLDAALTLTSEELAQRRPHRPERNGS